MDAPEPMKLDVPDIRISFKEKWELYKPLLETLYFNEKLKLPKIQQFMRIEKDFDAE